MDAKKVIAIHDLVIELDRQIQPDDYLPGIHNMGELEALFEWRIRPENDVVTNAACVLDSITARHIFRNGNKRTGLAVAYIMLESEGYVFEATEKERLNFLLSIAKYEMTVEDIENWLRDNTHKMGTIRYKLNYMFKKTRFGILINLYKVLKICIPKQNNK
jgi:death-on-curing family protein